MQQLGRRQLRSCLATSLIRIVLVQRDPIIGFVAGTSHWVMFGPTGYFPAALLGRWRVPYLRKMSILLVRKVGKGIVLASIAAILPVVCSKIAEGSHSVLKQLLMVYQNQHAGPAFDASLRSRQSAVASASAIRTTWRMNSGSKPSDSRCQE